MTILPTGLSGALSGLQMPSATKASNAKAAQIALPEEKNPAKSAVLDNTPIIQASSGTPYGIEALQKSEQAKTSFLTQAFAQDEVSVEEAQEESATDIFLEYMEKTPEERFWEAFLKSQNMTQEQFDALPPEEKEDLMEAFRDFMQKKLEEAELKKRAKQERQAAGQ